MIFLEKWQRDCSIKKPKIKDAVRKGGETWQGTGDYNPEEDLKFESQNTKEKKDNEKKEV